MHYRTEFNIINREERKRQRSRKNKCASSTLFSCCLLQAQCGWHRTTPHPHRIITLSIFFFPSLLHPSAQYLYENLLPVLSTISYRGTRSIKRIITLQHCHWWFPLKLADEALSTAPSSSSFFFSPPPPRPRWHECSIGPIEDVASIVCSLSSSSLPPFPFFLFFFFLHLPLQLHRCLLAER